jgi:uncharacterized protein YuzE
MYYKLGRGKVAKSRKLKLNGFEYVVDYDRQGEVVGLEILNLKKALALAASESSLLLAPLRSIRRRT